MFVCRRVSRLEEHFDGVADDLARDISVPIAEVARMHWRELHPRLLWTSQRPCNRMFLRAYA